MGDTVLVRQGKQNNLTTKFSQIPYTVINRKGSDETARSRNNHLFITLTMTFKFNPDILTLGTDNHMKMRMCNQHNSHAEQAEQDNQQNGLELKAPLNF